MWGAYTWLEGRTGGLSSGWTQVLRHWESSRGAQVAPENHPAVHWSSGELETSQGKRESDTHIHTPNSHLTFRTHQEQSECLS